MEQNPYAPPQAEVAAVGADPVAERPQQVALAVGLLGASIAIGVVMLLLDPTDIADPFAMLVLLVTFALLGAFATFIYWGHNWARIVFLILFILGAAPYPLIVADMFRQSVFVGTVSLAQNVLQAAALYLVFTSPGSAWFRRPKYQYRAESTR